MPNFSYPIWITKGSSKGIVACDLKNNFLKQTYPGIRFRVFCNFPFISNITGDMQKSDSFLTEIQARSEKLMKKIIYSFLESPVARIS